MSKSHRLLFDVTQLVHWPGKLAGITRVMQELAVRFAKDDHDAVFVSWVKELNTFCEINLTSTLAKRGQGIDYMQAGERANKTVKTNLAKRVAKRGVSILRHFSPTVSESLQTKAKSLEFKKYRQVEFKPGDILFITWGEWSSPNFTTYLGKVHQESGLKIVQVVHDMGPAIVPHLAGSGDAAVTFPAYIKAVLPISELILAVSQNTKRDCVKWLNDHKIKYDKMAVFREGDDFETTATQKPTNAEFVKSGLKGGDYILCVGSVEAKKNHALLYDVYKLALSKNIELPKLVIVGRRGWRTEELIALMTEDPALKESFVFQHDTSDNELAWFYENCLFTIFPSLYEGWGIPVAESLSRGVPCLCSDSSSLPEVGGKFVEYFSPFSTDDCLAKISASLKPAQLTELRKKAKQYKMTSWDETYQQVKEQLKTIL